MTARTVLVLGDQLSTRTGALAGAEPGRDRVLMIETLAKLSARRWHRQKLQYVWSGMRHFAEELRDAGFDVDYRRTETLRDGMVHVDPDDLVVMAPSSWDLRQRLDDWGVEQVDNDAHIVGEREFAAWADRRRSLLLEPFYRHVRADHGWLMDGDEPIGGTWNLDHDNREPPPRGGVDPPRPYRPREDGIDEAVREELRTLEHRHGWELVGEEAPRSFPVTRAEAKRSLASFVERRLEDFGPLEDAVVGEEPYLWHSMLSAPLNLGLLHPTEVCDTVDRTWRARVDAGGAPKLNSYEGFLRQVCGWREYVWGLYWLRMPDWRADNVLGQQGVVPSFYWDADTDLNCLHSTLSDLLDRAWVHHIPRLMLLGNYALLVGTSPQALTDWFHELFIDGYDWVMVPNVIGMSQWADGGVMATKPYAASSNYINTMTDYCTDCRYDRKTRTQEDSCPFNALYWDFMDRHRSRLEASRRMGRPLSTLDRFGTQERRAIRERAGPFRT